MQEQIVETKQCKSCGVTFHIIDKDMEFYDKVSPIFGGKKYRIPSPKLCPDCRQQRRLAFRNERKIYKRKCDATDKEIISIYTPHNGKVYDNVVYDSDVRDPMIYAMKIDFNISFLLQVKELLEKVPRKAIFVSKGHENSFYNNYVGNMRNCYLVFDSMESEDCYYGLRVSFDKNCVDCLYTIYSENCYQCIDCNKCYEIFYSEHCKNCHHGYFLFDCKDCNDCLLSVGLSNKQYYFKNKPYSKEKYEVIKREYLTKIANQGIDEIEKEFLKLKNATPQRDLFMINVENCLGDNLENASNSSYCYDCFEIENCKFSSRLINAYDCYDYESRGSKSNHIYESIAIGSSSYRALFGVCNRTTCTNVTYSIFLEGCNNVFGCVGLRKKEYCILNKQYTKQEYEELVPKIIEKMIKDGERGEFFPVSLSPFGYNETVAMEYFPLTKQEALAKGFNRSDYEAPFPQVDKIVKANELPNIQEVTDDILKQAIECETTKKPFRIIKQELEFYRKHNLPLPTKHPDQRHKERMALRNPRKLRDRNCMKCGIDIKTSYSPERTEIVYCEQCYNKEIY